MRAYESTALAHILCLHKCLWEEKIRRGFTVMPKHLKALHTKREMNYSSYMLHPTVHVYATTRDFYNNRVNEQYTAWLAWLMTGFQGIFKNWIQHFTGKLKVGRTPILFQYLCSCCISHRDRSRCMCWLNMILDFELYKETRDTHKRHIRHGQRSSGKGPTLSFGAVTRAPLRAQGHAHSHYALSRNLSLCRLRVVAQIVAAFLCDERLD